jgi:hypothetical protein
LKQLLAVRIGSRHPPGVDRFRGLPLGAAEMVLRDWEK